MQPAVVHSSHDGTPKVFGTYGAEVKLFCAIEAHGDLRRAPASKHQLNASDQSSERQSNQN